MKKSLLFFYFAVLMNSVFAQIKIWNGPVGVGVWSIAGNWSPSGVPTNTDTVIFNDITKTCDLDMSPIIAALRATVTGGNIINSSGIAKSMTIGNTGVAPVPSVISVASTANLNMGNGGAINFSTYGPNGPNTAQIDGNLFLASASSWSVNNAGPTQITNVDVKGKITAFFTHTGPLLNNSTVATFRFLSGSTLAWARDGGTIPVADYQNGSTINITGITTTMVTLSGVPTVYNGLLRWNCAGQVVSGASAVLLPTPVSFMDSILVENTGPSDTLRLSTEPNYTLGNLEVTGGALELGAPVSGNSTATIFNNLEISGGTVIGNATFFGDFANLFSAIVAVGGKFIMSAGNFILTNRPINAGLSGAFQLTVAKDVIQTGGTISAVNGFSLFPNSITLNGTLPQNLSMTTFSGPMLLEINNSSTTGVTLTSSITIPAVVAPATSSLLLTSGIVYSSTTNLLTMASGSVVSGAANASYVDGPVRKIGNDPFVFPVGKLIGTTKAYVPIGISAPALATDAFIAEYKRASAQVLGTCTAIGLDHVSKVDYWTLDRTTGTSSVDVTLYWNTTSSNGGSTNYITSLPDLVAAHFNGTNWDTYGPTSMATGTTTTGNVVWPSVSVFSPFSLGSINFANPLPITLNYLNGIKQNGAHYLSWKVTCFNNASAPMILERCGDGRNFTAINSVTADALRCQQPFDHTDNNPLPGMNYYRLKMTDANGKITYSTIIALLNKESGFDIVNLVPTLVTNNAVLNVTAAQKTKMDIVVTDISGRQVQKIAYNLIAGSNQFTVNLSSLSAGTYQIKGYTVDGISRTIRFVKQ